MSDSSPRRPPSQPAPRPHGARGGVDLDLLADYIGQAQEADEAARVAELVAGDSDWARVHADLVAADSTVRSLLAEAASTEPAMPAAVEARLQAAITAEWTCGGPDRSSTGTRTGTLVDLTLAEGRRRASSSGGRGGRRGRAARPLGRRIAVGTAAAAAAVVAALGGVAAYQSSLRSAINTAGAPMSEADSAKDADLEAVPSQRDVPDTPNAMTPAIKLGGVPITASGRDYTRATVGRYASFAAPEGQEASSGAADRGEDQSLEPAVAALDPDLARLARPEALQACWAAIAVQHPGRVQAADFARYLGRPALIVTVSSEETVIAVVVGPSCGPGTPDILDAIPI